jgi:type I restriction enzyme S subunit
MTRQEFFEKFELFVDAPDAVKKVRELVLRLAFSGGLSRTNSGRETGTTWSHETIGSIASFLTPGFACSRSHQDPNGHVHLRTHNVSTLGTLNFDLLVHIHPKMVDPQKSSLRAGDILFNNTNSEDLVGKTSLVDRDYDYAFSNHLTRLRLKREADPSFVTFYLTLLRNSGYFAAICTRWINQAAVNTEALKRVPIELPPLEEQKRIVAKVDELMALCDRLEAQQRERETRHAALARASLARFADAPTPGNIEFLFHKSYGIAPAGLRRSVVSLAFQGKLIPQDPNDEPAGQILKRLAEATERAIKEDSTKVPMPSEPIEDREKPFQIPVSWEWVRLGELASIKHGFAFSSQSFTTEPTEFVLTTPGHFHEKGGFRDQGSRTKYYRGPVNSEFIFRPGDLIIPMTEQAAGLLGSPAFIPDDGKTYVHNQRLGKLSFYSESVAPEFAFWFFNCAFFRNELARTCTGMKVRHTSPRKILRVLFPICALSEQRRIVAKVNQLMALVNQLETQLAAARAASAKLLDAIVGELTA